MAFRVFIDPGHGGTDPGAVYNERREKDDTLRLGLAVGRILEDQGVDVVYSRTDDFYDSPYEKAMKGNESEADLFLSIHRNSTTQPGSGSGADMLVYADAGFAADAANQIGEEIEGLGFRYNGITERPNLAVLRRTKMPAVLVEAGFINNENDNQFFDDNFDELAQAIAQGVLNAAYEEPSFPPYPYAAQTSGDMLENDCTDSHYAAQLKDASPEPNCTDHPHLFPMNCTNPYDQIFAGSDSAPAVHEAMQDSLFQGFGVMNPGLRGNQSAKRTTTSEYEKKQSGMNHTWQPTPQNPNENASNYTTLPESYPACPEQQNNAGNSKTRLYRVQVGAFTNPMFASQLLNQLLLEGYPAFIVYSEGLYRVQIGAFVMLDNAVTMERKLRNQGYQTFITT